MSEKRGFLSLFLKILRWFALIAVITFAVLYLAGQWQEVSEALLTIPVLNLFISLIFVLAGLIFGTLSWVTLLNGLGPQVPVLRGSQVMLVGQLGKFIPGSVWSYVMQMELGRHFGILRPRILITALYAAGIGVISSLVLGSLALPFLAENEPEVLFLFILLPIGLVFLYPPIMTKIASLVLRVFKRPPLEKLVSFQVVIKAVLFTLISYVLYGAHLWLLSQSFNQTGSNTFFFLTGIMALSFSASLFAFIFPSGIGVRELILISAMTLFISEAQATAVTLVSRLMFTFADLLAALIATVFVIVWRKKIRQQTITYLVEEKQYEESPLSRKQNIKQRNATKNE